MAVGGGAALFVSSISTPYYHYGICTYAHAHDWYANHTQNSWYWFSKFVDLRMSASHNPAIGDKSIELPAIAERCNFGRCLIIFGCGLKILRVRLVVTKLFIARASPVHCKSLPTALTNNKWVALAIHGVSDKGWVDQGLFYYWLKEWYHFLVNAVSRCPLLLLLNGHSCHFEPQSIEFNKENGVVIFFVFHRTPCMSASPLMLQVGR